MHHNSENTALTVIPASLKMSPKEESFCLAVVEGLSMSDAYRRAYKPQRAKTKTIHEKASRIMARGKVRARIAELMAPIIASAQMRRLEWLEWLTKCCRFDPRKMFGAMGRPKKLSELDDNEAAAIAVFEVSETLQGQDHAQTLKRTYKLRFLDRLKAFALLGKACHYYADRQEQIGPDGGPMQQNLTVSFVDASVSPEEAYRRMVGEPALASSPAKH